MKEKFLFKIFQCLNKKEKVEYLIELLNGDINENIKEILFYENNSLDIIPYLKLSLKKIKMNKNEINKLILNKLLLFNKFDVALAFNKTLTDKEKRELLVTKNKEHYDIKKENKFINMIPTVTLASIVLIEGINIASTTHETVTIKVKNSKTLSNNLYLEKNNINEISDAELVKSIDLVSEELSNNIIKFTYNGREYNYTQRDLGFNLNKENIINGLREENKVIDYNLKNTILNSTDLLSNNILYNNDSINNVVNDIYNKTKVNKVNGVITKLDGNIIKQTNGNNGLELNVDDLKEKIKTVNNTNSESSIELSMNEIKAEVTTKEVFSSTIGTLSSATTYYNESQGRATNIKIAVSKLNGKVIMPGEIFSYRNTVGPYDASNGYIFYAKDVGSGVCQVTTTLYNAQLKAGLETVARTNHYEPVSYVSKGLDATVYGESVDYKFKNNTDYPITIIASAENGVLTIGISGDSNILGGKSYLPRSVYITNRSYDAYLDVYQNGNIIETKYLGRSYYKY